MQYSQPLSRELKIELFVETWLRKWDDFFGKKNIFFANIKNSQKKGKANLLTVMK